MKRILSMLALAALGLAVLPADRAQAQPYDFATWNQVGNNTKPFAFVNSGGVLSANVTVPVTFTFVGSNPFLVDNALSDYQLSNVELTFKTTATAAATTTGTNASQDTNSGTMLFVYKGPNITMGSTNINTNDVVLSVSFATANISGRKTGNAANLGAADTDTAPNTVIYSSDAKYFSLGSAIERNLTFGLSSISSPGSPNGFNIAANGLLKSFNANGSGRFGANMVPEPATLAMVGLGLGLPGLVALRRRRAAR